MDVAAPRPTSDEWGRYAEKMIHAIDRTGQAGERILSAAQYVDAKQKLIYDGLQTRIVEDATIKSLVLARSRDAMNGVLSNSYHRINPQAHQVPQRRYVDEVRAAVTPFEQDPSKPITAKALDKAISSRFVLQVGVSLDVDKSEMLDACRRVIETHHRLESLPVQTGEEARRARSEAEIRACKKVVEREFQTARKECAELAGPIERGVAAANRTLMLGHTLEEPHPLPNLDSEPVELPEAERSGGRRYPSAYEFVLPEDAEGTLRRWETRVRRRAMWNQCKPRLIPHTVLLLGAIARSAKNLDKPWVTAMGISYLICEPASAAIYAAREAERAFRYKVRNGEQAGELERAESPIAKTRRELERRMGTQRRVSLEYWGTGLRKLSLQTAFDVGQALRAESRRPLLLTRNIEDGILDDPLTRPNRRVKTGSQVAAYRVNAEAEVRTQTNTLYEKEEDAIRSYFARPDNADVNVIELEDHIGIRCFSRLLPDALTPEVRAYGEYLVQHPRLVHSDEVDRRSTKAYGEQFGRLRAREPNADVVVDFRAPETSAPLVADAWRHAALREFVASPLRVVRRV